jgi:hypothetical protein
MRLHARLLVCGVVFSLFLGCRSGGVPAPVTGATPDNRQREMAKLAFLSYVGDALEGSDDEVEGKLVGCMNTALAAQAPAWELAWGPAVYHFFSTGLDDNMMYVARERAKPSHLAVVVRGTNPTAFLDWLVEDFDVLDQVSWSTGNPTGQPKVSKGTSEGLHILQGMTPEGAPQQTLEDFLATEASTYPGLRIDVTGHSLGGALAPTLALWLSDTQGGWDPAGQAEISVYPLAGPTAGNADFAAYYDQRLGSSTVRLWNPFDIVPLAWNHESMGKLADLYEPLTRAEPIERGAIDGLRSLTRDKGYTQINAAQQSLSGGVQGHICALEEKVSWAAEAGWQHHWGYQCVLGIRVDPSADPECPSKTKTPCPDICRTE